MTLGLLECTDNNVANVKRIMPEAPGAPTRLEAILWLILPYNTGRRSQKDLDTTAYRSIIIFTIITDALS
jgi:hypothetical protein